MERLGVRRRKSPKQSKAKKTPIKVVYISNPMKVKASVAEFRSVVQELTGQDSDIAGFSKYGAADTESGDPPPSNSPGLAVESTRANPSGTDLPDDACRRITSPAWELDECFGVSEMLDVFPGFLSPPLYNEPQSHGVRDCV
ncbi:hypothetical protein MUK42_03825 [Musa troglodytarum]|uniref:VQ domain-containing protein n=1 Tax=Musa troglodytarum TaxID=320322 RepID=A0A9E7KCC8_9LILI|nr:hypothetical protein MUK42_03825 [Musa troglodytarum]